MDTTSDSFNYYYVAVPPIKQLGRHTQPTWELSVVLKGRGHRVIGADKMPFTDGDTVLIPPDTEHCWYFDKDYTDHRGNILNISVMFSPELLKRIAQALPETAPKLTAISQVRDALLFDTETGQTIASMLRQLRLQSPEIRATRLVEVLLTISEHIASAQFAGSKNTGDSITMRRMQIDTYISCNYNRHVGISEIAGHIGMNKSSFCSFFHRNYGDTFIHHLNNYRLDQARYLLRTTDKAISDICYQVGFQSISHFNHLYIKRFGTTPGKDR